MTRFSEALRRLMLASVVLGLGLSAYATTAAAEEALKVGKSVPQAFGFVPLDVGVRYNIFTKYGVAVEILNFGGAPALNQALAAGSADIGLNSGADMALIVKGLPTKAVAAMAGAPLEITLVIGADSPIKTVADLKGKSVAVSSLTSLTGWLVAELSRQQGWGADGIKRVSISQVSGYLPALLTHQVDGITIDVSSAFNFERQGKGNLLLKFGDYVTDFHQYVISATDTLIANRPNVIRSFLKGWFETIAFMRANKDKAVAVAADVQHVDPDIAGQSYDIMMRTLSDNGRFNPKAVATLARSYVELGTLDKEPDMKTLYTEEFLPK